eukprot:CAMPEP_0116876460 /NCGR_PEP_ID=MMETSP0463-20121206/8394_1 /TAXON_ID=181622 /ORGANISM="Strombidinopsis sp, Strain SopsisLIS2011" /LENGTH=50 /DNA_ID=CAMNT_0004523071 /DNA_START=17 /DNA_END=169 /DNA_ORIENTATION=-
MDAQNTSPELQAYLASQKNFQAMLKKYLMDGPLKMDEQSAMQSTAKVIRN